MKMNEKIGGTKITLAHIERAAKWAIRARKAGKPIKIDGVKRAFRVIDYCSYYHDCGSACCIMGAAATMAHEGHVGEAGSAAHCALGGFGPLASRLSLAMNGVVPESEAPERVLKIIARIKKANKKATK